ncbi:hypothetical protein ACHAXT_010751 [Thalassiosira profunda]
MKAALLFLLGISWHAAVAASTAADPVVSDGAAVADEPANENEPHPSGGLQWKDLGASLSSCPLTTALMLDRYTNNNGTIDVDNAPNNQHGEHCLDDAEWLLHPSSGFVPDGSLCGIIGPSGAGKSTFLNALGGTTPQGAGVHLTGSVWYEELMPSNNTMNVDGCNRYRLSQEEGDIALLSQNDHFFDMLSPRESLEFAAYLELQKHGARHIDDGSKSIDHKEVAERKLATLGLMGVADRRIGDRTKMDGGGGGSPGFGWFKRKKGPSKPRRGGGLSGGERRRLSVALELVTEPKIFLADEPTTGLDSSQAERVVKLIAKLARERNVPSICTLHQPRSSIWRTLDQCILLAPGGKMCYAGRREDATSYFAGIGYDCPPDTNPAEYFIDLVTIDTDDPAQAVVDKARINLLHHRFLESCSGGDAPDSDGIAIQQLTSIGASANGAANEKLPFLHALRAEARSISNAIKRFGALLLRSWRQNIRNGRIIVLRLGASVVQAGLFASIFTSVRDDKSLTKSIADRVALLTYGVINMSIMALMKTLDLFAKERSVVLREQMRSNYSSLEYLLAKVFAEIPLDSFFALVFATLLKRLTGLRTSMMTLVKTYCLMTVTSVSLGFAIGSITSSVESALSLGVPVMVIFMVVGVINPSGVDSDAAPNPVMRYLKLGSPIKWAIEALVTSEFKGLAFGEEDRGRWGRLKDLPRMGALAMVQDGDEVLKNWGLGGAEYSQLMEKLALLSGVYLLLSWCGLSFFGPSFIDT